MNLPDAYQTNNIYVPGLARPDRLIEERYAGSRNREQRLYTDKQVAALPEISRGHLHYREWLGRKRSSRRLIDYLVFRKKAAAILEVGCGNGWLSSRLSGVPGSRVVGLDLNFTELQQAARVFHGQPNLKFIYGDFFSDVLNGLAFDVIVFSASIQFFPSLKGVLGTAMQYIREDGEIHILNTPFYRPEELEAARQHTAAYYTSLGLPEMADHTFHHCSRDLKNFRARYLYNPDAIWNKIFGKEGCLPWIVVRK